jgi:hypothetical protein
LWQHGTNALALAFASEANERWRCPSEVVGGEVEQFLNARAGVIQKGDEHVISFSGDC